MLLPVLLLLFVFQHGFLRSHDDDDSTDKDDVNRRATTDEVVLTTTATYGIIVVVGSISTRLKKTKIWTPAFCLLRIFYRIYNVDTEYV